MAKVTNLGALPKKWFVNQQIHNFLQVLSKSLLTVPLIVTTGNTFHCALRDGKGYFKNLSFQQLPATNAFIQKI